MKAASALDYRDLARRRLPHFLFEYIDGGSYGEVTLRRNVADLEDIALRQRVLTDVSTLDLTTTLFGRPQRLPVALAPIGLAGLNARRGEVQAARAAQTAGVPFCLSTVSACPIAEVAAATAQPLWFQLYMIRDRGFMRSLLAQAKAARCSALVFSRHAGAGLALPRLSLGAGGRVRVARRRAADAAGVAAAALGV
ncbi:isopentenyl diphosphate isomerase/L-lactate dehydrogenase-like FMN-dependent dehydrogenase [Sphingomonas sp. PvP055]